MTLTNTIAFLISLAAIFSWLNARFLKLPTAIGLMLLALSLSLLLLLPFPFAERMAQYTLTMVGGIDFNATVLQGMLGVLLFAGALHVDIHDLAAQRNAIISLTTVGVLLSSLIVGILAFVVFVVLGFNIPFVYCLLFGALISPTDPIAVLGMMKSVRAPKSLETKITGESLFNDGVAVVLFLVLFDIALGDQHMTPINVALMFGREALGGILFGFLFGLIAVGMLKRIDNYQVEVLVTLAVASGGYAIAESAHISAPIAVVVAGLIIGNKSRTGMMSARTREHLDSFWELVDEFMNAVLFVLIGLEVLVLSWHEHFIIAGTLMIPIVLLARALSVGLPLGVYRGFKNVSPGTLAVLTWGGIRGGVSVALALSLPPTEIRDLLVTTTYMVVVFSIMAQGLTLKTVIRRFTSLAVTEFEFGNPSPEPTRPEKPRPTALT